MRLRHDGGVARVPIACTLTEEAAVDRVDEWRQFLGASVVATEKSDPASARLLLDGGDDVLLRAVDLAEREKDCCAFFDFGVDLDERGRWLTIGVPADAAPILEQLLALAAPS
jgi:hypothetical protein